MVSLHIIPVLKCFALLITPYNLPEIFYVALFYLWEKYKKNLNPESHMLIC